MLETIKAIGHGKKLIIDWAIKNTYINIYYRNKNLIYKFSYQKCT